ncbi:MAG: transposase [Microgenomates group bacterium]|jgi:putative transposase
MPYRLESFQTGNIYHVYNRGVEKRLIFTENWDYQRFLQALYYYQFYNSKNLNFRFSQRLSPLNKDFDQNTKLIDMISYCLMPNHFHLLIKQLQDGGIQKFMQKILNSHTRFFNTKHKRVGPLFQGNFKAVPVETDEQLMQVSRYIHLNPYIAGLTQDLNTYPYSSYQNYIGLGDDKICNKKSVISLFKSAKNYEEFVVGHEDYARDLALMSRVLLDED